jgi:hypothetical protein
MFQLRNFAFQFTIHPDNYQLLISLKFLAEKLKWMVKAISIKEKDKSMIFKERVGKGGYFKPV